MHNQGSLAKLILMPIIVFGFFFVVTLIGGVVALRASNQAAVAALQFVDDGALAAEIRSYSRAAQRDALKMADETWAKAARELREDLRVNVGQMVDKSKALFERLATRGRNIDPRYIQLQKELAQKIQSIYGLALAGEYEEAKKWFPDEIEPTEKIVSKMTDDFVADAQREMQAAMRHAESVFHWALIAAVVGGGMMLAVALRLSSKLLRKNVIAPLRATLRALKQGDDASQPIIVEGADRQDEIGDIARAIVSMRQAEREQKTAERAMREERERADRLSAENQAERAASAERQRQLVAALADSLRRLASGDLRARLAPRDDDYAQIADDFNRAAGQLEQAMSQLAISIRAMESQISAIAKSIFNVSRRTENQSAAIQQSTTAISQVASASTQSATSAQAASEQAAQAANDAQKSRSLADQAVEAINSIRDSSSRIGGNIMVIDEIAFQTNLLALNAGVEAARAGDAGKGFAVVAAEVRGLAQRSADAAREIKALIEDAAGRVEHGVNLVDNMNCALAQFADRATAVQGMIDNISADAGRQSALMREITSGVESLDRDTQANAEVADQTSSATQSLLEEAQRLIELMARFKVAEAHPAPQRAQGKTAA